MKDTKSMQFYANERIGLFIDGASLYSAARALDFEIDYKRLYELFRSQGILIRAFYYAALLDDQEYSPIRPLIDWLDYNGFTVVTKPAKEFVDSAGRRKIKGNMDIELTVDALEMADKLDHIVLFSGDGDFCRLIEAIQHRGKRVTVVSTLNAQPLIISDELRRQADHFLELDDIGDDICRDAPAPARSPTPEELDVISKENYPTPLCSRDATPAQSPSSPSQTTPSKPDPLNRS